MKIKQLEEFGLSDKEAKVYLALISMEHASVSEIASRAGINRTTAYDILEALANYGLISHFGEAKKKLFMAENPEILVSFLKSKSKEYKEKAEIAKENLPELKGLYNAIHKKPKVKYYEGDEGIIAMYEDSLNSKTEILSWLNPEHTTEFSAEYFQEYYKRRAAKGIHIKAIVNESKIARSIETRNKKELREMKILPKKMMDIVPECYIYDDKVAFMSLKEKFGVMIESKDIAEAQRRLFELAWIEAGKYK